MGRKMALSPSRAADFRRCPLLYRLRAIDQLPEPISEAQVRGLVVHGVLERLYGLPAAERTEEAAEGFVEAAAEALVAERPGAAELWRSGTLRAKVSDSLVQCFKVEDPRRLSAHVDVEMRLEVDTDSGVPLKGFIDRLDTSDTGLVRVNDYKVSRQPSPGWEDNATYQLKLYALMLWLVSGTVPAILRLVYLNPASVLELTVTKEELKLFERRLTAVWAAILRAGQTGDFRPSPSKACSWCSFHAACPAQGGTPPAYPGWPENGDQ